MVAHALSPESEVSEAPQLPRFYMGRELLITGGTGFMGKVLIERLLSTCPDIGRLHLLLRSKKDASPEKRLLQLKQSPVFAELRERCPGQLDKLCVLPGDTALPALGISDDSLKQLREVSVVLHAAASVRFTEPLRRAVDYNVRSVLHAMDLADQLPRLEAFVHVSTAYSNTELKLVEERVYPAPVPLHQLLALVDAVPEHLLEKITDQYISPKPNTYTFTKAMAESAVVQRQDRRYPLAIFRPSIVSSCHRAPVPGWNDNVSGTGAFLMLMGSGLLHAARARCEARCDLVPADLVADCLLATAWELATDRPQDVRVYNCTSSEKPLTWGQFKGAVVRGVREYPFDNVAAYPYTLFFENRIVIKVLEALLQTLPLYIAEYGARLCGDKPKLCARAMSQRLQMITQVFAFFMVHEWSFVNDNLRRLRTRLASDRHLYHLNIHDVHWDEYFTGLTKGIRRYLMSEKDDRVSHARRRMERLRVIHYLVVSVLAVLLFSFIRLMYQKLVSLSHH